MAKEKACLNCRRIYEGAKCPSCGEGQSSESHKGKVFVFDNKKSQIARSMKLNDDGEFAIKPK